MSGLVKKTSPFRRNIYQDLKIEILIRDFTGRRTLRGTATVTALIGIVVFVVAAIIGPQASHPDYTSIGHTVSELAGQAMPNAWIMRTGFVAFGLGTVVAATVRWRDRPFTATPLVVFGMAMISAAIWSNAPIDRTAAFSVREDEFHSIAASLMGTAFAVACLARLWMTGFSSRDWLSWLGLAASIGLPLAMLALPDLDGGLQRVMFGISFVWLLREMRSPPSTAVGKA